MLTVSEFEQIKAAISGFGDGFNDLDREDVLALLKAYVMEGPLLAAVAAENIPEGAAVAVDDGRAFIAGAQ